MSLCSIHKNHPDPRCGMCQVDKNMIRSRILIDMHKDSIRRRRVSLMVILTVVGWVVYRIVSQ